jgi:hypothetical protein
VRGATFCSDLVVADLDLQKIQVDGIDGAGQNAVSDAFMMTRLFACRSIFQQDERPEPGVVRSSAFDRRAIERYVHYN